MKIVGSTNEFRKNSSGHCRCRGDRTVCCTGFFLSFLAPIALVLVKLFSVQLFCFVKFMIIFSLSIIFKHISLNSQKLMMYFPFLFVGWRVFPFLHLLPNPCCSWTFQIYNHFFWCCMNISRAGNHEIEALKPLSVFKLIYNTCLHFVSSYG